MQAWEETVDSAPVLDVSPPRRPEVARRRGPEWLVLADPDGPMDVARLFPDVEIRVEPTSAGLSRDLAAVEPGLVVLFAPPAGAGDLQQVAAWLAVHPSSRAVLLSAHDAVAARLHALELGFDDAIDLAADPMEVVGRLSIVGHHAAAVPTEPTGRLRVAPDVELDLNARALFRSGRVITLRPKEFDLLEFFARHPGRAFARHELLQRIWRGGGGNERVVDVYIFWLRSKIEADARTPHHLVTVRGSGYRFDPPAPAARAGDVPVALALSGPEVNEPPIRR